MSCMHTPTVAELPHQATATARMQHSYLIPTISLWLLQRRFVMRTSLSGEGGREGGVLSSVCLQWQPIITA